MQKSIRVVELRENEAEVSVDGRTYLIPFVVTGSSVQLVFEGEIYTVEIAEKGARNRARHRDHSLAAPMPGAILKILVQPGSVVRKGEPLVILEAMKMEHQIVAPYDGTVSAVNCAEGQMVEPGLDLVTVEKSDE